MTVAKADRVVAITSFVCEVDGVERFVHPGEPFAANDPVVKKRRELFTPETATAAPGLVR